MRTAALIGAAAAVLAASVALVIAGGTAGSRRTLDQVVARTARVASQRYTIDVQITRNGFPTVLHIRGTAAPGTIFVHVKMGAAGPDDAALLDGPFFYLRAPSYLHVTGRVRWQRVAVSTLGPDSPALTSLHDMTPSPLLRVLGEARAAAVSPAATVFRGTVAYDDPVVVTALQGLTGGVEFQDLRVTAWVGRDGLLRGVRIAGRTVDRKTTLDLNAKLFGLGRAVHVVPPAEGTFFDRQLLKLSV
jgi:hypothetical protein